MTSAVELSAATPSSTTGDLSTNGGQQSPSATTSKRKNNSCCGQIGILLPFIFKQKWNSPLFLLFEVFIPLYPILVMFAMKSVDMMPFELEANPAASLPPSTLVDQSALGLATWAQNTSSLAFAPDTAEVRASADEICQRLGVDVNQATWFVTEEALAEAGIVKKLDEDLAADFAPSLSTGLVLDPAAKTFTIFHHELNMLSHFMDHTLADLRGDNASMALLKAFYPSMVLPPEGMKMTPELAVVVSGLAHLQAVTTEVLAGAGRSNSSSSSGSGGGDVTVPSLYVAPFPVPEHLDIQNSFKILFPVIFASVYFLNLQATLSKLGLEQERGIKEVLGLKAMNRWAWVKGVRMLTTPLRQQPIRTSFILLQAWSQSVTTNWYFFLSMFDNRSRNMTSGFAIKITIAV